MAKPSWTTASQLAFWNPQERDMVDMFRELGATDLGGNVSPSDSRYKLANGVTVNLGLNSKDYDIRDFGSGMYLGNDNADTAGLQAAVAAISNDALGTNSRPGRVIQPRGTLLLNQTLNQYGNTGTASSWVGVNGRSKGPDGSTIQWVGADGGIMWNVQGCNAFEFRDICLWGQNGTNRARFGWWCQYNRTGNVPSSDVKFVNCQGTSFGHLGAPWLVGDEVRTTLTLTSVSGTFAVGEQVLDNTHDGVGVVLSWNSGTGQLALGMVMGTSYTTPGTTVTGLTSGATGSVSSVAADGTYTGTGQFSEAVWEHPVCQGTELSDVVRGTWAAIAFMGSGNNKNFTIINPRVDGSRYAFDGASSGYLRVSGFAGGNVGHNGLGAVCRIGGIDLTWDTGDFENGASTCKARFFDLGAGSSSVIYAGEYFGLLPADGYAIKNSGQCTIIATKLGADTGTANIQNGGTLNLLGVGWRENITTVPVYDGSGNNLTSGDYARSITTNYVSASACRANVTATSTALPDVQGQPLSPLWNQVFLNNSSNCTVVTNGRVGVSDPTFTVSYTQVQAGGGQINLGQTPDGAIVRGVKLKTTSTFGGGALSAVTVSVGTAGTPTYYMGATDVHTAVGVVNNGYVPKDAPEGGDYLKLYFAFTGATSAALTQGALTVIILYEKL